MPVRERTRRRGPVATAAATATATAPEVEDCVIVAAETTEWADETAMLSPPLRSKHQARDVKATPSRPTRGKRRRTTPVAVAVEAPPSDANAVTPHRRQGRSAVSPTKEQWTSPILAAGDGGLDVDGTGAEAEAAEAADSLSDSGRGSSAGEAPSSPTVAEDSPSAEWSASSGSQSPQHADGELAATATVVSPGVVFPTGPPPKDKVALSVWDGRSPLEVNDEIRAQDKHGGWYCARIVERAADSVRVHFKGWSSNVDEWMESTSPRITVIAKEEATAIAVAAAAAASSSCVEDHRDKPLTPQTPEATSTDVTNMPPKAKGPGAEEPEGGGRGKRKRTKREIWDPTDRYKAGAPDKPGRGRRSAAAVAAAAVTAAAAEIVSTVTAGAAGAAASAPGPASVDRPERAGSTGVAQPSARERYGFATPPKKAKCGFCGRTGDGTCGEGQLFGPFGVGAKAVYAHHMCATWAPGVVEVALEDGKPALKGVMDALTTAKSHDCSLCGEAGGGVVCCGSQLQSAPGTSQPSTAPVATPCPSRYHFACMVAAGCAPVAQSFECICPTHTSDLESSQTALAKDLRRQLACEACFSAVGSDTLLFCISCGVRYHRECVSGMELVDMSKCRPRWQCPTCKACDKCNGREDDEKMVVCDTCDLSFHVYCLQRPLESIPLGRWKCDGCVKCQKCGVRRSSQWHADYSLCHKCHRRPKEEPLETARPSLKISIKLDRSSSKRKRAPTEVVAAAAPPAVALAPPIAAPCTGGLESPTAPPHEPVLFSDAHCPAHDLCVSCGSLGRGEEGQLVFCVQCGDGHHVFCLGLSVSSIDVDTFKCMDCITCEVCDRGDDEDKMLVCDSCHRGHHIFCLTPPLKRIPQGRWICAQCPRRKRTAPKVPASPMVLADDGAAPEDSDDAGSAGIAVGGDSLVRRSCTSCSALLSMHETNKRFARCKSCRKYGRPPPQRTCIACLGDVKPGEIKKGHVRCRKCRTLGKQPDPNGNLSISCSCGRQFSSPQALGGHRGKCTVPREKSRQGNVRRRKSVSTCDNVKSEVEPVLPLWERPRVEVSKSQKGRPASAPCFDGRFSPLLSSLDSDPIQPVERHLSSDDVAMLLSVSMDEAEGGSLPSLGPLGADLPVFGSDEELADVEPFFATVDVAGASPWGTNPTDIVEVDVKPPPTDDVTLAKDGSPVLSPEALAPPLDSVDKPETPPLLAPLEGGEMWSTVDRDVPSYNSSAQVTGAPAPPKLLALAREDQRPNFLASREEGDPDETSKSAETASILIPDIGLATMDVEVSSSANFGASPWQSGASGSVSDDESLDAAVSMLMADSEETAISSDETDVKREVASPIGGEAGIMAEHPSADGQEIEEEEEKEEEEVVPVVDDSGAAQAKSFAEFKSIAESHGFKIWRCEPVRKSKGNKCNNNRYNSMNRAWLNVRAGRTRLCDYDKESWLPLGDGSGRRRRSKKNSVSREKRVAHSDARKFPVAAISIPCNPPDISFESFWHALQPALGADLRTCELCRCAGDGEPAQQGRLLNVDIDQWVHVNCALWCFEVTESSTGALSNVPTAVGRGQQSRCQSCSSLGASIVCSHARCDRTYHLHCAQQAGCTFLANREVFCAAHSTAAKSAPQVTDFRTLRRIRIERSTADQMQIAQKLGSCVRIGSLTVVTPGEIDFTHSAYHCRDRIYPVGLTTTRIYWSMTQLYQRASYTSEVVANGDRPIFRVTPSDVDGPHCVIQTDTPEAAWREVQRRVARLWEGGRVDHHAAALGAAASHTAARSAGRRICPDRNELLLFGFTPMLEAWIEGLPGASNCSTFKHHARLRELYPHEEALAFAAHEGGCCRAHPYEREEYARRKKYARIAAPVGLTEQITQLEASRAVPASTVRKPSARTAEGGVELDASLLTQVQQYRRLAELSRISTYVSKSLIQGMGLRASRSFHEGEMVIEYVGELVRKQISEHRERLYNRMGIGCYMFGVHNHNLVIDATMKGGAARFINHSCEPNCISKCVVVDRRPRIVIVTTRDIAAHEEFCYDYKFEMDDIDKVPCNCGAGRCRGFMN